MKNNTNALVKRTFLRFIGIQISWFIGIITIFLVAGEFISRADFEWLYELNPDIYFYARNVFVHIFDHGYIFFIMLGVMMVVFLVSLYQTFKRIYSYISAISDSSEQLFDKREEYINLPFEMKELEQKLNHFKREALKNERLAKENERKKDELIVYLAHDIKTPLTSMIGYLSLLDEIKDIPQQQRERYVAIALDKAYRLEDLINELFDVARFNSEKIVLEKEMLNLNLMLEQIIDDFYPLLKEMNKEIFLQSKQTVNIFADSDKLGRVFSNLIKNAIYYSQEDSDIFLVLNVIENNVEVKVINKGRQIPEEKLNRIFDNFYRADNSRTSKTGGSGLGLAIAKEIVELHGGSIVADSNEKETVFTVTLPLN